MNIKQNIISANNIGTYVRYIVKWCVFFSLWFLNPGTGARQSCKSDTKINSVVCGFFFAFFLLSLMMFGVECIKVSATVYLFVDWRHIHTCVHNMLSLCFMHVLSDEFCVFFYYL